MPTRKTQDDYYALAKMRGFEWVGEFPFDVRSKTLWRCKAGHEWDAAYDHIKRRGCPYCSRRIKKTAQDYYQLAEACGLRFNGATSFQINRCVSWTCLTCNQPWDARYNDIRKNKGGCPRCKVRKISEKQRYTIEKYETLAAEYGLVFLGSQPKNSKAKTLWQCPDGHKWEASYHDVQQGKECPHCTGRYGFPTKTIEDYHALAAEYGIEWIGETLPANTSTRTLWRCSEGHEWEARYASIRDGHGCHHCVGSIPKSINDYHSIAAERGFQWIGDTFPANTNTPTLWRCQNNHVWTARCRVISENGSCPYCAGKKDERDYHKLANQRGWCWLGHELPINTQTPTLWHCSEGHEWKARYNDIQQGRGCPHCAHMVNGVPTSQPQRDLAALLDGELNYPHGNYFIDVALYLDGVSIAIEYNGWYYHQHRQQEDAQRAADLIADGWHVLYIQSNTMLPTEDQLNAALIELTQGATYVEIVLPDWKG